MNVLAAMEASLRMPPLPPRPRNVAPYPGRAQTYYERKGLPQWKAFVMAGRKETRFDITSRYRRKSFAHPLKGVDFVIALNQLIPAGTTFTMSMRKPDGTKRTATLSRRKELIIDCLHRHGFEISDDGALIFTGGDLDADEIVEVFNSSEPAELAESYVDAKVYTNKFFIHELKLVGGMLPNIVTTKKERDQEHLTEATQYGLKCLKRKKIIPNNCLLECVRTAMKYRTKQAQPICSKIRTQLKLGKSDMLGSNDDLQKLEGRFGVSIGVVIGTSPVEEYTANGNSDSPSWENLKKFRTEIGLEPVFSYGNYDSDIWVMLKNEHFTLVSGRSIPKEPRCYITGMELAEGQERMDGHASHKNVIMRLCEQGRLAVDWEALPKTPPPPKPETKTVNWVFDYETIYDDWGELTAYSASMIKLVEGAQLDPRNKFFAIGQNCSEQMFEWLHHNSFKNDDNILITYNGRSFDYLIATNTLLNMDLLYKRSVCLSSNKILDLKWGRGYRTCDVNAFVAGKLADNCVAFGVPIDQSKIDDFCHEAVQKVAFKERGVEQMEHLMANFPGGIDKLEEYNVMDCVSTGQLYLRVRQALLELTTLKMEDYKTLSQLSFAAWDLTTHGVVTPRLECWDMSRQAAYAGRSQIFRTGVHHAKRGSRFACFDVKSLYPFVMMSQLYPTGAEFETEREMEGFIGVYNCKVGSQKHLGHGKHIIPERLKNKALNWNCDKLANMTPLFSEDIACLRKYGVQVEVSNGFYWKTSANIFDTYCRPIAQMKTDLDHAKDRGEAINLALRQMCKELLNCLSGKMLQRKFERKRELCVTQEQVCEFLASVQPDSVEHYGLAQGIFMSGKKIKVSHLKVKPAHIGAMIYCYARRHMYEAILSKLDTKIWTDTDSCGCDLSQQDVQQLLVVGRTIQDTEDPVLGSFGIFRLGGKFGNFEDELVQKKFRDNPCTKVIAIAPKNYGLWTEDPTVNKMCFKGIGRRDKYFTNMDVESFNELTIPEQFQKYIEARSALTEETYTRLAMGQSIPIICSQIKRCVGGSGEIAPLKMKQDFVYKTIKSPLKASMRIPVK